MKRICVWLFSLIFGVATLAAQSYTLKGDVVDETGDPLLGASVIVKGSAVGASTNIDGQFALIVKNGDVVQVTYIGYLSQELTVTGQNNVTIKMEPDNQLLDEVVVVGYGTVSRKNFTGSVSSVKVSDSPLSIMPTSNAMDALRGTVTGITVSQQQGAGQDPSMQVRGQKSINGGSDPLLVVDGVIYQGSLRDIDPGVIESMSVLKDATSLAAYGSKAANGVIMITTKKGVEGKPVVSLNASWAFSNAAAKPDLLSPKDYVRKNNLLAGLAEDADPTWMGKFEYENYQAGRTTDWFDYATRTGVMQNYGVTVSGATNKVNYYVSGSYTNQEGVVRGDDYERFVMNSRLTADLTDWLQIGTQMNYAFNDYSGASVYDLYQTTRLSPYGQPTRVNGEVNKYPCNEGVYRTNPLWNVLSNTIDDHDTYATTTLKGHLILKCPWVKGLQFRMNGSFSTENIERDYFTHEGYYIKEMSGLSIEEAEARYADSEVGQYLSNANGYNNHTKYRSWVWDNILSYTGQFGNHYVDATAVYTRDSRRYFFRGMTGSDYKALGNTILGYDGLNLAATQKVSNPGYWKHNDVGYLARVNYNYDQRYHLSASIRRDGSSVFGDKHKWGNFPAVGVAWTVSNESFWEKVPVVNNLKVKASWGKNGNQSLSPYGTLSTITLGQKGGFPYPFGNTSETSWGQRITAMGNESLGWETTTSWNFGFELGAFNDRILLDVDAYTSKTTDQIFNRTIPVMINGLTSMAATMGRVDNWGIEINLNTTNIQTREWIWTSSLNFYLNRNKLKDLYGDGKDDISNARFIGKSLGAIYGYKNIGIVQEDDVDYIQANGAQPGDVKFYDKDGNGKITSDDRMILGYSKENFRMGFSNTVKYKNFTMYAMFTGVFGGNGYGKAQNLYAYRTLSDVNMDNNLNHGWWTAENRSNKYPRINYTDGRYTPLQSYTFVRLADLSLSYDFNQSWVKKAKIQNLRLYVAAKNLFTITGWDGGDPEIQQTVGTGYSYGYPLARTFSLGINVTL
ncbi:MAG: TonB-dependent receptor [Muribaculum sp.]|nr:TonB-dependent receptor [Muribaculaceae bacterium]MCM1080224.1 TonB-dependent receptor [Muribaculum sp.]